MSQQRTEVFQQPEADDILILCLEKGREKYTFIYLNSPEMRSECLRTLGRFASDPGLSFNWWDCACLAKKIREGAA